MASPKVKKRFGQHFITDPGIARKVAEVLVHPGELYWDLVEVGPGKGMLTQAFQEAFQDRVRLWGIEVDEHWHQLLLRTFPSLDGRLFRESILKLDFQTLLGGQPFGLVGNLPYNIASQIILKAVESRQVVPEIAGTFQLEVAQRLIAEPCNRQYGLLSIMFQAFYEVKLCFRLPPGAFSPPPRVHSAVVRGIREPLNEEADVPYDWMLAVVKQAFQQRRKKLSNNLKAYRSHVAAFDAELLAQRPETIAPHTYRDLARYIGQAEEWPGAFSKG